MSFSNISQTFFLFKYYRNDSLIEKKSTYLGNYNEIKIKNKNYFRYITLEIYFNAFIFKPKASRLANQAIVGLSVGDIDTILGNGINDHTCSYLWM